MVGSHEEARRYFVMDTSGKYTRYRRGVVCVRCSGRSYGVCDGRPELLRKRGSFLDLIARQRRDGVQPHFQAIVQLYTLWENRLSKEELQKARTALDAQIAKLPDKKITPIGASED